MSEADEMGRDQDYSEFAPLFPFYPHCLLCGKQHVGRVCSNGDVMCVYCMGIVKIEELAFDGNDRTDVCVPCWEAEQAELSRRSWNTEGSGT